MQYLLMIYANESEFAAMDPAALSAMSNEYGEFTKAIVQAGGMEARIALTSREVCGLTTPAVARAFLVS